MMYDLIVIGGGPAGYRAAKLAGKAGLNTLMIEKREIGGVCLNEGCIPTKTLLYSAKIKESAETGEKYGVIAKEVTLDHTAVIARKDKVVKALVAGVKMQMKSVGVKTLAGNASVLGLKDGFEIKCGDEILQAKRLLIATGSVPIIPPIPGLKEAIEKGFAITSREMLSAETVPQKLAVIGGGVIGLEMASYLACAGSDVTVIEMLDQIGGGIDKDMARLLKKNLEKKGIKFMLGCRVSAVGQNSVTVENGKETEEVLCTAVLLSVGRRAATEGLGLENIGVLTEKGAIVTDEKMKTNVPGVYAAGDVNGKSMLAHTAYREAEVAVNAMLGKSDDMDYRAVPGVIFTLPEVAGVGDTEETARAKGAGYQTIKMSMQFSGRYLAENEGGDGIAKLIIDDKGRIAGFHMIGNYVSEIIYGACMMVGREMTAEQAKKDNLSASDCLRDHKGMYFPDRRKRCLKL